MPLIDAAPLIVAGELGYFRDEGLHVTLDRQIGWGNVRDKLTFGRLDASHGLVGMPLFSQLNRDWFAEPLIAIVNLGRGCNAITISRRLADAGVSSATTLADFIRRDPRGEALIFGHVFSCSMHHYLLRQWLSDGGTDPERDVRLRIFPPPQMTDHLAKRFLDGFCVGEPWNTLAEQTGVGRIVALTTDLLPDHPEKALVVTRKWAQRHSVLLPALIRAVLRGCAFRDDVKNHSRIAEILAKPAYLAAAPALIATSLELESTFDVARSNRGVYVNQRPARASLADTTFPSLTHSLWILEQMKRWNQLVQPVNEQGLAARCVDTQAYRAAAATMGIACPETDSPPMTLRNGLFDPASLSAAKGVIHAG